MSVPTRSSTGTDIFIVIVSGPRRRRRREVRRREAPRVLPRGPRTEGVKEGMGKAELDAERKAPSGPSDIKTKVGQKEEYRRRGVGGGVNEEQADEDAGSGGGRSAMKESMWLEDSRVSCASAREVVRCNKTRRRSERVRGERYISWPT